MGAGGWVLVLVLALALIGPVIGFFTEAGSGIALRPWRGGAALGAKGKEEASRARRRRWRPDRYPRA